MNDFNNFFLRVYKSRLLWMAMLILFSCNPSSAGFPKSPVNKWQIIEDYFYIDTNDFEIENELLSFWVKQKNYNKRRLTIDCRNLVERELYNSKFTKWNPIIVNTPKYEIAKQLCFFFSPETFSMERKRRQPSWVKRIIFVYSQKEQKEKELKKNKPEKSKSVLNNNKKEIRYIYNEI